MVTLPPRTVCYPLPLGRLDGQHRECLTSYVLRLAVEHAVTPVTLVRETFPLIVGKFYGSVGFDKPLGSGQTINGLDVVAEDWVHAFTTLTGRRELASGTLLAWQDRIPARGLLGRTRRWCPACYQEARERKDAPADALDWTLASVTTCIVHQVALADTCPGCQKPIPWLPATGIPGDCPRCGEDLATAPAIPTTSPWDEWVAHTVAHCLGQGITGSPKLTDAQRLRHLIDGQFQGNAAAFAREIGYPKNTVAGWLTGEHQPNLDAILRICWLLGISLYQWLTADINAPATPSAEPLPTRQTSHRRSPHPFPQTAAEALFEIWKIPAHDAPIPSARQMAEALGVNRRTMRYKVSADLHRLAELRRRRQTHQRMRRERRIRAWMVEAVRRCEDNQIYPGQRAIEPQLPKGWSFREPTVRTAWHQAVASSTDMVYSGNREGDVQHDVRK